MRHCGNVDNEETLVVRLFGLDADTVKWSVINVIAGNEQENIRFAITAFWDTVLVVDGHESDAIIAHRGQAGTKRVVSGHILDVAMSWIGKGLEVETTRMKLATKMTTPNRTTHSKKVFP